MEETEEQFKQRVAKELKAIAEKKEPIRGRMTERYEGRDGSAIMLVFIPDDKKDRSRLIRMMNKDTMNFSIDVEVTVKGK